MRIDSGHPPILDAKLFLQLGDLFERAAQPDGKDVPETHGVCNILASGKTTAWVSQAKIITYFESNG